MSEKIIPNGTDNVDNKSSDPTPDDVLDFLNSLIRQPNADFPEELKGRDLSDMMNDEDVRAEVAEVGIFQLKDGRVNKFDELVAAFKLPDSVYEDKNVRAAAAKGVDKMFSFAARKARKSQLDIAFAAVEKFSLEPGDLQGGADLAKQFYRSVDDLNKDEKLDFAQRVSNTNRIMETLGVSPEDKKAAVGEIFVASLTRSGEGDESDPLVVAEAFALSDEARSEFAKAGIAENLSQFAESRGEKSISVMDTLGVNEGDRQEIFLNHTVEQLSKGVPGLVTGPMGRMGLTMGDWSEIVGTGYKEAVLKGINKVSQEIRPFAEQFSGMAPFMELTGVRSDELDDSVKEAAQKAYENLNAREESEQAEAVKAAFGL